MKVVISFLSKLKRPLVNSLRKKTKCPRYKMFKHPKAVKLFIFLLFLLQNNRFISQTTIANYVGHGSFEEILNCSGLVYLSSATGFKDVNLVIRDVTGRVLKTTPIPNGLSRFRILLDLDNGVYVASIVGSTGVVATKRLIIQN